MFISKASMRMAVRAWTSSSSYTTSSIRSLQCQRFVMGRDRLLAAASSTTTLQTPTSIRLKSSTTTTQRNSAVEEDLDAALDDILGEVYEEAQGKTSSSSISTSAILRKKSVKKLSSTTTAAAAPRAPRKVRVVAAKPVEYEDDDDDDDEDDDDDSLVSRTTRTTTKIVVNKDVNYRDEKFLSITNPHWVQAGLSPDVINVLSEKGFTKFTPVQAEAFAHVMAGRDVMGQSRTGTGKTLAFGLPSFTRLVQSTVEKGTRDEVTGRMERGRKCSMIILCPTRELARQVQEELSQVSKPLGLFVEVFHGGVSYDPQTKALRQGVDVIVGTPGRVIDHINRGNLDLSEVDIVVLDEADEMLRMGFAEDVEVILEGAGSANDQKFQCLLFSATAPSWVKAIARKYQRNTVAIDSTNNEGGARTATTVKHTALRMPKGANKHSMLEDIIAVEISREVEVDEVEAVVGDDEDGDNNIVDEVDDNPVATAANARKKKSQSYMQRKIFGKTIVFTETKREADELVSGNVFKSLTAQALHGDVGQKQRDATLNAFRAGAFNVLVATDVAARGIDIQDVDLVVQMGPPRDVDTYVHRSGRTGRAGQRGKSLLLFGPDQARDIVRIERDLGHGFKFDLVGPPSAEAALRAAAKTSALASKSIPDETAEHFKAAAAALLAENADAEDVVARCLAAISRRSTEVQSRSLLTGEVGYATVEMSNSRGKPISANDVMFTVGKLARMSRKAEVCVFESDVGKIQVNEETGVALFDMGMEDANKLIEFSKDNDAGGFEFTILKELEVERDQFFGKSAYGDRRGGGGGGGGGRFSRGGDRDRFEPRVFRGSSSGGRFGGGGGGRSDGRSELKVRSYRSNEGNYHGGNQRSDHENRPSRSTYSRGDTSTSRRPSGGSSGGGGDAFRSRRFVSDRNNDTDGW